MLITLLLFYHKLVLVGGELTLLENKWIATSFFNVPSDASPLMISSGKTDIEDKLYVGRVHFNGSITAGKVHKSLGACYTPYVVFIGGWGNTKSVIRRNRTKPEKAEIVTPKILNCGEFRGFWIRWDGGVISAGREGESIPFISWTDPEPFPISYVGVCTGWGASGTWKIEGPSAGLYSLLPGQCPPYPMALVPGAGGPSGLWVDASLGKVPPGAVVAGKNGSGEALYVARAQHNGALTPGKLVGSLGCVYLPWGGDEHRKTEYQVLVGGSYMWVPSSGSNIPSGVLPAGKSEYGEPLFVGRVHHEGTVTNGKVQKSHGVCYIPFYGKELAFPDYEVLTQQLY